jgi:MYXO-CTERM domain-containing protein
MKLQGTRIATGVALLVLATHGPAHAQCGTMPPGTEQGGLMSMYMGGMEPFVIYLPPGYATGTRRYPVVYWFHGRGDNQCTQLPLAKNIQEAIVAGASAPLIYVFINGGSGCNFDDTTCAGKMVESYVMRELIPYIDAHYRTIAGPGGRAIEGFSMGAEAVLRYFNKYPDQFCDAVSYAPIGGGALTQRARDVITAKGKVVLRLVVGTADGAHLPGCRNYEKMLMSINLPHEYEELAGVAHNPFGLYGAMGGVVGRRGLAVHTRCFAAVSSPTDGGPPSEPGQPDAASVGEDGGASLDTASSATGGASGTGGVSGTGGAPAGVDAGVDPGAPPARAGSNGCGYAAGAGRPTPGASLLMLALLAVRRRRRPEARPTHQFP